MKVVAVLYKMKGELDDNYTLYENGEVLHEYDKNRYPNGYNLKETLVVDQLENSIKQRLLDAASDENKKLASEILGIF